MLCRAPGKIVLWGEYAVLAGAPAVIMAVDRYASVDLQPRVEGWHLSSRGFLTPSIDKFTDEFAKAPVSAFAEAALQSLGHSRFVKPFSCVSDTSDFFAGAKLGIGSSAALCTATYTALARWLDQEPSFSAALDVHQQWQGGTGSGLDVAASWHGGVVRFERAHASAAPAVAPFELPQDMRWQVVWTGSSASTVAAVGRFSAWRSNNDTSVLDALASAAREATRQPSLSNLANYQQCLRDLDDTAHLKVFTPEHDQLGKIAAEFGLVYKPCGAGGGDIGTAFGNDPSAFEAFGKRVDETPFHTLSVEIAEHGIEVSD